MAWLRMARRFTRGSAARLALTVLAVAWGVALVAGVCLANHAVLRAFVEVIDTMAGRAALEVVAGEGGLFPEGVAATVGTVPGVEAAAPSVKGAAYADGGELLTVYGVDLTGDAPERVYGARLELDDPLVFLARPDSIALARPFAAAHGLALGDRIELATPVGRRALTLLGLLDAEGVARAYGGNVAVMDLFAAEELFTRRGFITGVDVVVAPDADVREVAEVIVALLPAGLRVEAPAQRQADLRRVTDSLRVALQALGLFGLVAAFLITFNRLSTVFEERAWQLGVLRAVGLRTGAVWRALLGESLLVGAAGVVLGIPLGLGLGRLLVPVIATASAVANKLVAPPAAQARHPSAACGLLATALVAAGTALAARPAVHAASFLLGAGSRRLAGPVGRLAAASLLHNPRRTALAVGLGCVVWFWTMAQSFRTSLVDALSAAVRADLVVTSAHVTSGYVEAPVSEEVAARLAAVPGVAAVIGSRVVDWPPDGRRIAIEAFDARYFADAGLGRWPLARQQITAVWNRVAGGEAAIVSENFLVNFGARVGDSVVLETPSGPLVLVIGGATAAFESPAGTIQMSREVFTRYWRDRQVNRVGVHLAPGTDVAAVRAAIARDLAPAYDLRILSARELIGYYAAQVGRAFAPLHVLAATVLLVTLLGVADTLLAAVLGRTRELGAARAVGVRRAPLVRMVFIEALLLGGLGLALALTSGVGLAALWVNETLPYLLGWVLELHLPYREVPVLAALTVAVAGAAAMLPARRAARLEPGLALREE